MAFPQWGKKWKENNQTNKNTKQTTTKPHTFGYALCCTVWQKRDVNQQANCKAQLSIIKQMCLGLGMVLSG